MRSLLLFVLYIALCLSQKSVDTAARDGGCSTAVVASLSTQLIQEMNCINSGLMSSFSGASGFTYADGTVFPYLQTSARNALVNAVAASGRTLRVNSALRTLAQQYLLYRWNQLGLCGITAAASPGNSNHNGGLAVDVNDYSTWISLLTPYGFKWFGNGDKPHFTYTGAGTQDVRSVSILAFQKLWNLNNPNDMLKEDGGWGPATELRLQRSPVTGFPIGPKCNSPNTPTNSTRDAPVSCTVAGQTGLCLNTADCTGTSTAGYCPGASNIQCCTKASYSIESTSCSTPNGAGSCQDISTCAGTSYAGYCPGANNIRCCVAGSAPPAGGQQTTNQAGVDLIKSFEGYYANFYIDPVGIKTIGYGHACHVFDCSNLQAKSTSGNFYKVSAPLSRQAAEDLLRGDLEKGAYEDCVRNKVTRTITDNQFSALVSFTFNLGCGALSGSTLLKRVNSGAAVEGTSGIRSAFLMWNKAGGKVLAGLTRRRNGEADLYAGKTTTVTSKKRYPTDGVGEECWFQGEKGVCLYTDDCTGKSVPGLCPGPNGVQCCTRNKCNTTAGTAGLCVLNTMCGSGLDSNDGLCQGSTDVQCCSGTINEKQMTCPDGTVWDKMYKWCADTYNVYGPFTTVMINQCLNMGGEDVCRTRYPMTVGGTTIGLMKWEWEFALSIRGTGDCFPGSKPDTNFQGYCVEFIGNLTQGVQQTTIVATMDADIQSSCTNYDGGSACVTSRWSGDFFRSMAVPFRQSLVLDDELGQPAPDTSSNSWTSEQQKYSADMDMWNNGDAMVPAIMSAIAICMMLM